MSACRHCRTTEHPVTGDHLVLTRRCFAYWRPGRRGPGLTKANSPYIGIQSDCDKTDIPGQIE
jgi:hypothetical protein